MRIGRMTRQTCLVGTFVCASLVASVARAGNNSLLGMTPDGRWILAANADNGTVTVVDAIERRAVREIAVGRRPESVAVVGSGPLAVVTLYKDDQVAVIDFESGRVLKKIDTPDEPYGIVVTRSGKTAYLTNEYPGVVSELDLEAGRVVRQIPVGPFVRGIALDSTEQRLYVTEYYTGILRAIELSSGTIVDSWQGSPADNLARHVALHPTHPKAYVSHIRSRVGVAQGDGSIFPFVSVIDTEPGEGSRRKGIGMDTFNGVYVVANPWELAISPDGKRVYSIYSGTNDMNVSNFLDDNYREFDRVGVVQLGHNPRAITVSPDSKTVYIYNTLDFELQVLDADSVKSVAKIKVCDVPYSAEHLRGKTLFYSALQPMVGRRWISCASCHPDGGHDARTWQNPEGLRNTTGFLAMAHTYPIHWSADRDEAQDFEITIRGPLMQGRGLIRGPMSEGLAEPNGGKSADLDALAEYSNSFEVDTLSPHAAGPGRLTPAAERGRQLFFSDAVGCATCHRGPYYTDCSGTIGVPGLPGPYKMHDVGTGTGDPSEKMGSAFDTPTLLGIYRTAPYLHHGKAATLLDVLVDCNRDDRHGRTSHLKPAELDDLIEFLKSLPYEIPEQKSSTQRLRSDPIGTRRVARIRAAN
jgi:YVTN family beta-propeller protein